jgi:hypothetical protein
MATTESVIAEIDGCDWGHLVSFNTERRPADPYH